MQNNTHGNTKHGDLGTRLYVIWKQMRARCNRLNVDRSLGLIGYIGITCCKEWDDFIAFKDWSLANGYQDHLTLDRKENHLGYSPDNCKWSTYSQQMLNRRTFGKSKFRGVSSHKERWQATYTLNSKAKYIGVFDSELKAALAYDDAVLNSGTNSKLNFPERCKI